MLQFSKKTDYGLVFLLTLAKQNSKTPVSLSYVVRQNQLPKPFLAKLAASLVQAGIIKSKEGVKGGYILVKKPSEISLGEIINVLEHEKNNSPINCGGNCSCQFCTRRDIVAPLEEEIEKTLEKRTLADFLT